ncbi:PAS domain-containing protein [Pseudomonas sp. CDFA 602]|uniref:hybrid sensor histidine kinase/response regulator n=1 Tax=Pseudomonas californiensis TaxID=2829823 RepID=UPI001E355C40|nr:PAS domain-containing sensor histidine kinase [Pseudomonas californiensis]MCD5992597.1 PAS domain-containing protein [Pseudomonas californiensis]MCD5998125.1 PAS domain-containing protein [Pseudomonas californiensis]
MEQHVHDMNWGATPLGERAFWPPALTTLASVVSGSNQPMFVVWGPQHTLIYNDAYAEILAAKHPAALGCSFLDVWAEIRTDLEPIVERAYSGQAVSMDDITLIMHRKGYAEETHFAFSYTPVRGPNDTVSGFLCVCLEITDRISEERTLLNAQAALRHHNTTLEQQVLERTTELNRLWDTSPDLLLILDFRGIFLRVNPAWTELLGYRPDELIGHHVNEFVVAEDHDATVRAYTLAAEGGMPKLVNRYRHKDGSLRWISWVAAPAADVTYATGRNITLEKKQADTLMQTEEALRQSQKLEAIGQLTGGVAHDFNNLLTVIKSSADMLKRPDLPDTRRYRYVAAISETVDRAAKLTSQLLAFARRQALRPEVFAVCDSVRSLSHMMNTLTGSRIRIVMELPDDRCFVEADPSQFDTALVNMALNARDAMNGEGVLTIRVATVERMPAVRAHDEVQAPFVTVSISDNGMGIPKAHLDKIFEPFFTTKRVGQGTGLGLSQVFGFAKQSGGEVLVDSEPGQGSTFTLYLARVPEPQPSNQDEKHEPVMDGLGTCVLVVEDNVEVGGFAVQSLSDMGYIPVLAHSAEEALAELAADADRFDVVFSDVIMPGMNGIDLAHRIRETYQDLPVLLASGYSHILAQHGTYGFELLHKPYSIEQLSRLLRKITTWKRRRRIQSEQAER